MRSCCCRIVASLVATWSHSVLAAALHLSSAARIAVTFGAVATTTVSCTQHGTLFVLCTQHTARVKVCVYSYSSDRQSIERDALWQCCVGRPARSAPAAASTPTTLRAVVCTPWPAACNSAVAPVLPVVLQQPGWQSEASMHATHARRTPL